ncbi:MAG: NAD+ synthase, partial [Betaproteobacteria bacterium]|nr:NAD+ synthase [Betaproteobacteria bacterium]
SSSATDLLLTPELSICGYPPEDLILYRNFLQGCENAAADLAAQAGRERPDLHLMFGLPVMRAGNVFNSLRIVRSGQIVAQADKIILPNYGVFDEARYFTPGNRPQVTSLGKTRVGICVCQDAWDERYLRMLAGEQIDLLIVANASPFYVGKQQERERITAAAAARLDCEVVYVNYAGAQDEYIYDGGSHYQGKGGLVMRLGSEPQLADVAAPPPLAELDEDIVSVRRALVAGLRSYVGGRLPVLIGISGGIDSAVVACVAVEAFGADGVLGVLMPSRHTAQVSLDGARSLAANLGIKLHEIAIDSLVEAFNAPLAQALGCPLASVAGENLQARIRAVLLMALANHHGSMLLATGNKSEMAVGFTTIYGDMAGAFAPLKDVSKTRVYQLAHLYNRARQQVPECIIERAPSAELRPDQLDEDTLPPYDQIDALITKIVEDLAGPERISDVPQQALADFSARLKASEFKRQQAPVGPTITRRAFGKDWRMPISNAFPFISDERSCRDRHN